MLTNNRSEGWNASTASCIYIL